MEGLAELLALVLPVAKAAPFAMVRTMGAFALFPLLPQTLPRHLKIAVPMAMWPLILMMPGPLMDPRLQASVLELMGWLLAEFAIGIVITLPAGVVFWAAQSAGELIDIKTGANNNAVFGTGHGAPEGPAQIFMSQLAAIAFLSGGGLLLLIDAVLASYRILPVGGYGQLTLELLPQFATEIAMGLFKATFVLFGPFFAFFLLVEFALGLAGKLASQLQVTTVTAPAKSVLFAAVAMLLLLQGAWFKWPTAYSLQGMRQALDWLTR